MDKKNIEQRLIDLFAEFSVEEIDARGGSRLKESLGVKDYRKLVADDTFKEYYNTLKELRMKLDEAAVETGGLDQVKGCLRLFNEIKNNDSRGQVAILSQLIKKGFYNKWKPEEQTYYDLGREMLTSWKDFFLSYTNRNPCETNNNFKEVLSEVLGKTYFDANQERVNCVAQLVFHYLHLNNLSAFFDKDKESMTCGDNIKEKILTHCRSVFAFVQLVEPVIFQAEGKNRQNWCYREFQAFDDWSSRNHLKSFKRYYFILTEDDVFPAKFPPSYGEWKKKVDGYLHIEDLSSLNKKQIREKVYNIAREIEKTREEALDRYIEG